MNIDWDIPKPEGGVKKVKVERAEDKTSKKGEPQIVLTLRSVEGDTVRDYLTFGTTTKWAALRKLEGLGIASGANVETSDLVGKSAYASLVAEEFNGQWSLKVDNKASKNGWCCGYRQDAPDNWTADVPF